MLVAVTGFGSVWRYRPANEMRGRHCPAQPVYYNTTGVVVNGSVRQRPQVCGYARFDPIGGFNPNCLLTMVNLVFECAQPSVWMGFNKLLFKRILNAGEPPDRFLVVAKSDLIGQLRVGAEGWRSPDTWLLSFSGCAGKQEVMLLMGGQDWIRSDLGHSMLRLSEQCPWSARLALNAGE